MSVNLWVTCGHILDDLDKASDALRRLIIKLKAIHKEDEAIEIGKFVSDVEEIRKKLTLKCMNLSLGD